MTRKRKQQLYPRQAIFVQELLAHPTMNATASAIAAGYSEKSAAVMGHRLLNNPVVKKELKRATQDRMARLRITQDRVIREYAKIAFADARNYVDEDGIVKGIHELDDDAAGAISDVEVFNEWEKTNDDKEHIGTRTKIKMHDKKSALEFLAKHLGIGHEVEDDNMVFERIERVIIHQQPQDQSPPNTDSPRLAPVIREIPL